MEYKKTEMWVKNSHLQRAPHGPVSVLNRFFDMPWMAANPSKSSSSFGDYPALSRAGTSFPVAGWRTSASRNPVCCAASRPTNNNDSWAH